MTRDVNQDILTVTVPMSVHRDTLDRTAKNNVADSVLTENHVINSVECVIVVVGMDTLGTNVTYPVKKDILAQTVHKCVHLTV